VTVATITRIQGLYVAIAGGVVGLLAMLMPFTAAIGPVPAASYWQSYTRYDIVVGLALAAIIALALIELATPRPGYTIALVMLCGGIFDVFAFPVIEPFDVELGSGVPIGFVSGVLCLTAGLIVMFARFDDDDEVEAAAAATARYDGADEPEPERQPMPVADRMPPAGWYQDPLAPERRRYWDGERWTDEVREG
jgi:uncharacterized protein DUF2510